jgi:hypothetical protein
MKVLYNTNPYVSCSDGNMQVYCLSERHFESEFRAMQENTDFELVASGPHIKFKETIRSPSSVLFPLCLVLTLGFLC